MHAAYNAQIVVSNGFVVSYYVSQDRTAIRTLQPAMEQYYRWYGTYPERLCADAGYGSFGQLRILRPERDKSLHKVRLLEQRRLSGTLLLTSMWMRTPFNVLGESKRTKSRATAQL